MTRWEKALLCSQLRHCAERHTEIGRWNGGKSCWAPLQPPDMYFLSTIRIRAYRSKTSLPSPSTGLQKIPPCFHVGSGNPDTTRPHTNTVQLRSPLSTASQDSKHNLPEVLTSWAGVQNSALPVGQALQPTTLWGASLQKWTQYPESSSTFLPVPWGGDHIPKHTMGLLGKAENTVDHKSINTTEHKHHCTLHCFSTLHKGICAFSDFRTMGREKTSYKSKPWNITCHPRRVHSIWSSTVLLWPSLFGIFILGWSPMSSIIPFIFQPLMHTSSFTPAAIQCRKAMQQYSKLFGNICIF